MKFQNQNAFPSKNTQPPTHPQKEEPLWKVIARNRVKEESIKLTLKCELIIAPQGNMSA